IICHNEMLEGSPRAKTQLFAIFIPKTWGATVPDRLKAYLTRRPINMG
ncbi:hypothetical protein A2U01_0088415, partial [Trifolium medium]|nr:hypothetical protein [Trifolium medium]